MVTAAVAGFLYFVAVFALGFMLGTLRVLMLAPAVGEELAVLAELPIMLAASWAVAVGITRRLRVPPDVSPRALMGALALVLLLLAEVSVSVLMLGRTLSEHLAAYRHLPAASGLAAQLLFGAIPLLHGRLAARGFPSGTKDRK